MKTKLIKRLKNKTAVIVLINLLCFQVLLSTNIITVGAVTLSSITPDSGNVGTTDALTGAIDTQGGAYTIWFDINSN